MSGKPKEMYDGRGISELHLMGIGEPVNRHQLSIKQDRQGSWAAHAGDFAIGFSVFELKHEINCCCLRAANVH
jgi:hypothetical protein